MPRYDVPKLADYSGAIQANQSMSNAFANLGNQSQDYLKLEEQKNQNAWNRAFEDSKFAETKNQNAIANQNADRTFNYGVTRDGIKDNQWQQAFDETKNNNTFDQNYKTNMFNHTVSQDNINNGFKQQQLNKPEYATFNGVDTNGNPTLNMVDKNTGKVVITGQQVYNENKKLAPEQSMYYIDRANEMKQKNTDALQKSLTNHPAYSKLSEEDKVKAYDYVSANGKLPEFKYSDGGLFGSEKYTILMSEAVKQEKQKELEKNMKALGL